MALHLIGLKGMVLSDALQDLNNLSDDKYDKAFNELAEVHLSNLLTTITSSASTHQELFDGLLLLSMMLHLKNIRKICVANHALIAVLVKHLNMSKFSELQERACEVLSSLLLDRSPSFISQLNLLDAFTAIRIRQQSTGCRFASRCLTLQGDQTYGLPNSLLNFRPEEHKSCSNPVCAMNEKKVKLLKCGQCKITLYCSPDCQKGHWKIHKKHCKKI